MNDVTNMDFDDPMRHLTNLHYIIMDALKISGQWNGDERGRQEDRAHQADEIADMANKLRALIIGMDEL